MGLLPEKLGGFADRHPQYIVNVLSPVADLQNPVFVALPLADIAREVKICKELHFHFHNTVPLTGIASASGDVEGKRPRLQTLHPRRRG